MRTLLNESFPPNLPVERIFSRTSVLAKVNDLVEVGVGETVIATPSVSPARVADAAALERGVAMLGFVEPKKGAIAV
jgi:hypothetical protein